MPMVVNPGQCTGQKKCVEVCPVDAISMVNEKAQIDPDTCIECGACMEECPEGAISEG